MDDTTRAALERSLELARQQVATLEAALTNSGEERTGIGGAVPSDWITVKDYSFRARCSYETAHRAVVRLAKSGRARKVPGLGRWYVDPTAVSDPESLKDLTDLPK